MKLNTTIKSLSAVAALALAGCLGTSQDETDEARAVNAKNTAFARATVDAAVNATGVGQQPDFKETAAKIRAFGCPVLADVVEDIGGNTGTEVPASLNKIAKCFNISGKATANDIDTVWAQVRSNLTGLLDCICGGTALSDALNGSGGGKISAFSAATSNAAASSFNSSQSSAGTKFDASSSNPGGGSYGSGSSNTYTSP